MAEAEHLPVNFTTLLSTISVKDENDDIISALNDTMFTVPIQRRKHVNGVSLPVEESRRDRYKKVANIAAIDFGTTSCSVAYCVQGDQRVHLLKLGPDDVRVPTAILMDVSGKVVEFGKNARRKYAHVPSERKQYFHFFSEIKMSLQHDQVILCLRTPCLRHMQASPCDTRLESMCHS